MTSRTWADPSGRRPSRSLTSRVKGKEETRPKTRRKSKGNSHKKYFKS